MPAHSYKIVDGYDLFRLCGMFVEKISSLTNICCEKIVKDSSNITNNNNNNLYIGKWLADELFEQLSRENTNLEWLRLFKGTISSTLFCINIRINGDQSQCLSNFLCNACLSSLKAVCFKFYNSTYENISYNSYKMISDFIYATKSINKLGFQSYCYFDKIIIDTILDTFYKDNVKKIKLKLSDFYYVYSPSKKANDVDKMIPDNKTNNISSLQKFITIIDIVNLIKLKICIHNQYQSSFTKFIPTIMNFVNLKVLMLHGVFETYDENRNKYLYVNILQCLPKLEELDISIDNCYHNERNNSTQKISTERVNNLLSFIIKNSNNLNVKILDISGYCDISPIFMKNILTENTCLKVVKFLRSKQNFHDMFSQNNIIIDFWETYTFENCIKYLGNYLHCPRFIYHILKRTRLPMNYFLENEADNVIRNVICVFNDFPINHKIRTLSSELLLSIVIHGGIALLKSKMIKPLIDITIKILKIYCHHDSIQHDGIIILTSILFHKVQGVDYLSIVNILLKFIRNHLHLSDETLMSCAFESASRFITKLPDGNYPSIYSKKTITSILTYIKMKHTILQCYRSTELAIYTLWNITDMTWEASENFVALGGVNVVIGFISISNRNPILCRFAGVFNNIAEVPHLRKHLVNDDLIDWMIKIMSKEEISCSFFAAGTLANIAIEWKNHKEMIKNDFNTTMQLLMDTVIYWGLYPHPIMVCYRSFYSIISLLKENIPAVQLWGLWTIRHVCRSNPRNYFSYLCDPYLSETLCDIYDHHQNKLIRLTAFDIIHFSNTGTFLDISSAFT